MKALKQLGLTLCVCLMYLSSFSQDTSAISQKAKFYADSMCRAYFYEGWQAFTDLTMYSAIKYYGGKEGYTTHFKMLYFHNAPDKDVDKPEQTSMVTLLNKGTDEWQCVLEKIRHTTLDNRKARVYSYLVGQSKDDGDNWKFVDVGQNSEKNIIYIFPEVFGTLAIPEYKVVYEDEEAAKIAETERASKAAESAKAKPVKKATPKKK